MRAAHLRSVYGLPSASVRFLPSGQLYSEEYQDVYYSAAGAVAEFEHVFWSAANLSLLQSSRGPEESLCVAELGFGSACNFLLTAKKFEQQVSSPRLEYLAFEKHPLPLAIQAEVLRSIGFEAAEIEKFQSLLPQPLAGIYRLHLSEKVSLTLCYGEAQERLRNLRDTSIDVWFLDGFSPARNPALWSKEVLKEVRRLSAPNCALLSYSVARVLKDNLSELGWVLKQLPGFAHKREMLRADLPGESRAAKPQKQVAVIGAGLAGAAVAYALSRRGVAVTVFEELPQIAARASGNFLGIGLPHLALDPGEPAARYFEAGYQFTCSLLERLKQTIEFKTYRKSGVLRLNSSARLKRLAAEFDKLELPSTYAENLTAEQVSELSGLSLREGGIHFPGGFYLSPAEFAAVLFGQAGSSLELLLQARVRAMSQTAENKWELSFEQVGSPVSLRSGFDAVVIADAFYALEFSQCAWLPLEPVRGQLLTLKSNSVLAGLKMPLCYDGYLTPALDQLHCLGATFQHQDFEQQPRAGDGDELISRLRAVSEDFANSDYEVENSRVSFRTMSRDRLPLVGPLPVFRNTEVSLDFLYTGLYCSLAHGARGLVSCPLAAELVAAQICGEILPLEQDLLEYVEPQRFLQRVARSEQGLSKNSLEAIKVAHMRGVQEFSNLR